MCGIYAVFSPVHATATSRVFAGLQRLEYRGYDSWGIASLAEHQHLVVEKHIGQVGLVKQLEVSGTAGVALGHTRWATHGGVTVANAHPHLSQKKDFAVVHNGVIENNQQVRTLLEKEGRVFVSETDTEAFVGLLEQEQQKDHGEKLSREHIFSALHQVTGRNTFGVMTNDQRLFLVQSGSSLVIGQDGSGGWVVSSDLVSLAADTSTYYVLQLGEVCELTPTSVKLFDCLTGKEKSLVLQPFDVKALQYDKGKFAHFMEKEIAEQSSVLVQPLLSNRHSFQPLLGLLRKAKTVFTLGAGSADFVGQQGAYWLRQQGIHVVPLKAGEASTWYPFIQPLDVCLVMSQSGETADTLDAVEHIRKFGAKIVSVVNVPGSSLTRLSDMTFLLQIGPEIGIASTKAVTAMLSWLWTVSQYLAGKTERDCLAELTQYQFDVKAWLKKPETVVSLHTLATELMNQEHLFLIGKGQLYIPTLEAALKLKEVSYIHAEGFSSAELKHGVLALISPGTSVLVFVADDDMFADSLNAAAEVRARGGRVIGVSAKQSPLFDVWISLPQNQTFVALSSIIVAQRLTYDLACVKKLNPDKPRNLAKSVTVK